MASSSNKTHKDYNYPCHLNLLEEEEWLELGLGINSTTRCKKQEHEQSNTGSGSAASSSSSLQFQAQQHIGAGVGLDLRLGIGLGYDNTLTPPGNYHNTRCLLQEQDHDYFDGLANSSSLPSWIAHNCSIPTRPHTGLWFTLRSSTNRDGEALPQIPKAYIRVKGENVTVFMVKKYLVRKLGLSNEDEVDISCMGQKLLQTQTLKEVRDCIWLPSLVQSVQYSTTISPENSLNASVHHLMSLHYVPRCVLN